MKSRQGKLDPKKPETSIRNRLFIAEQKNIICRIVFSLPQDSSTGSADGCSSKPRATSIYIHYAPKSRQLHTQSCSTANPHSYKIKAYQER